MPKSFAIAFLVAIGFGFVLLNPWFYAYYLILLALATAVVLIIVVYSLAKRTKGWKAALLCLMLGYTAALTSYGIQAYLSSRHTKERYQVIAALYNYRYKYGLFPPTTRQVSTEFTSLKANYVPETTLQNFTLYTRDIYGMPCVFSSKDSTWTR